MEEDNLDGLFRKAIADDNGGSRKEEQLAKEQIWDKLDLPKKKQGLWPWRVAAAILFLLLAGGGWTINNRMQAQNQQYSQLEQKYAQTELALQEASAQVAALKALPKATKQAEVKETTNTSPKELLAKVQPVVIKEVEQKIYLRDTIWLEAPTIVQRVRDTIYVKVSAEEGPAKWVRGAEESLPAIPVKEKIKPPKKIEFVFGKKPIAQPGNKKSILIPDSGITKKTKKDGITTFSIKK